MIFPYNVAVAPSSSFTAITSSSSFRSALPSDFDQIKIINVKSNTARWNTIQNQLRAAGILKYDRIDAVDATEMDLKTLRSLVTTDAYIRILGQKQRTSHADISTKGQVACALSHKLGWHQLVYGKSSLDLNQKQPAAVLSTTRINNHDVIPLPEYVTILEDDAIIPPDTPHRIRQALKTLPKDADIILYGFIGTPTLVPGQSTVSGWAKVSKVYGLHSYSVTKRAAKLLLDNMGVMDCQLDSYLNQMASKLNLNMYISLPSLVHQGNFASTIQRPGDCLRCGPLL